MFEITDFEPCPLCGDMPRVKIELRPRYEYFAVTCDCGVVFTGSDVFNVDLWNIRPENTCEDLAKADDEFTCSNCGFNYTAASDDSDSDSGYDVSWINYCPYCGLKVIM